MSMTTELIKRLRQHADTFAKSGFAVDGLVKDYREAADTIQLLSEKLHASQTEPCEDIKDALHIAQTDRDKWKARAKKLAKIIGIRDCDIDQYKQEHCVDAISRAEAMNVLDAIYLDGESAQGFTADANGDCLIGKYKAIEILEELPSVTPSCEEREKGECPYYAG